MEQIKDELENLGYNRYPDPLSLELRGLIAGQYGLKAENVFVGNGGDEVILDLYLSYGGVGRKAVTFDPMFEVYTITGFMTGTDMISITRSPDDLTATSVLSQAYDKNASLIFLCCPNNPTGDVTPLYAVEELLKNTEALVVVDEAYAEFCDQTALPLLEKYNNLAILRTFSKAYSLAGLRAGYLLAGEDIIENMTKVKLFYNFNRLSQAIARIAIQNRVMFEEKIRDILKEKDRVFSEMTAVSAIKTYPSEANFILFKTIKPAAEVWQGLVDRGILIRNCSNQVLLENCLRVSIGTPDENDAFLKSLREIVCAD
ncbi:MAG: histidinol-phosphate transaminase, partial [Rubrobacteridae bacterium]|nr:histidinol-phosphate transaminase [Rubrobacteridae bacterium]